MGALWPLLVMTGMHRVFTPTIIQTIAETGKEGMVMPSEIGANLSLGGSSLAVAWKTKNPELRQTALAAAASAIMAGISEPALYGGACQPLNGSAGAIYQRAVLRSGESNEHRLGVRGHGAGGGAVVYPHTVARL